MKAKKGNSTFVSSSDNIADTSEHDGIGLSIIEQEYRILFDALDRDANGII